MRRAGVVAGVAVAFGFIAFACDSGDADAPSPDGGDAGADVSTVDATRGALDAALDAAIERESCPVVLTEAFDPSWDPSWTVGVDPGGSVGLQTASPFSPPNALRTTVADDSGIFLASAALSRRTETDAGSRCASLHFKVSVRSCDALFCFLSLITGRTSAAASSSVGLVVLNTASGGVGLATTDSSDPGCGALLCDFAPVKDVDGNKLRLNATGWYDVTLDVDARIDPPRARLDVGSGGKLWSAELSTKHVVTVLDRLSTATIGLPGVDSPGAAEAWFDDLQVGLQAR